MEHPEASAKWLPDNGYPSTMRFRAPVK